MTNDRLASIASVIKDLGADSVLDVGARRNELKQLLSVGRYSGIDIEGADINVDLNKVDRLPLDDKTFDVVVLSHVLEHVFNPQQVLAEATRVSKKYVIIGLPNDFAYALRLRYLLGSSYIDFREYEHKGVMSIDLMPLFLKLDRHSLKIIKRWHMFAYPRLGRRVLRPLSGALISLYPKLFANEVFFLCEKV
jgi:SAM-dependent methyltransferase